MTSMISMMSPARMALSTAAMMVAMMLPSFAPMLWRYHRRTMRGSAALRQTALFAAGYAAVWTLASLTLFAMSAELSPTALMGISFAPATVGLVALFAGAAQCSPWKARQLLRCRAREDLEPRSAAKAVSDGCRLGIDCCLSCAPLMAMLFAAGLMDMRMMVMITAAITAERITPRGERIARLTGAVAVIVGLFVCTGAVERLTSLPVARQHLEAGTLGDRSNAFDISNHLPLHRGMSEQQPRTR